jgi:hypothetical protein
MTVKELKTFLEKLPDAMPIILLDLSNDDEDAVQRFLQDKDLDVIDGEMGLTSEKVKALAICYGEKED